MNYLKCLSSTYSSGWLHIRFYIYDIYCLEKYKTLPEYSILNKFGNEHAPIYEVCVHIENHDIVSATGTNLKNAEEAAATKLLGILKI